MTSIDLKADHAGDFVILRNSENDIVARMDPEKAIILSQDLLEAAEKSLRDIKEEE